ncbi:MAG: leucine-rich repeat domain-containing protein, partial [Spirulinaceae cyanobacterium]
MRINKQSRRWRVGMPTMSFSLWRRYANVYAVIALGVGGSWHQVMAQAQQFKSFADWCKNREGLTSVARHTVEVLLREAETEDCQLAQRQLTNLNLLNLGENKIKDITPVATLTNLTGLYLGENEIKDITPVASLTNLGSLELGENEIEDITPVASLTNLTSLDLG